MIGVEIDPDLVMTSFTQNMLGFFYLITVIGIMTVSSVWLWMYWQKIINER